MIFIYFIFIHVCICTNTNPPVIIEQPQDILAELDKPMALHCRAESASLDDLRVTWYKDGKLVTMDPNARIITEFMALHVINTMPQDAGSYYCVAENSYGRTQSRTAKVQFIKLDKEFIVSPTSTTASIGEHVRLRCEPPHGSPPPIVHWTKDGKNLSHPLDHHDLVFSSIQSKDFGSYRCIASNGLIRQSSVAHLTEFHRPKITIRPSTSRIDLHRGKSIDFQCHVQSSNDDEDQYEIEWRFGSKNGKLLGRTNRLDISSVDFNHTGSYLCLIIYNNNGHRRQIFSEEIYLAVHERINNGKIYSQNTLHVYPGRSAIIHCPLPLKTDEKILWKIINRSENFIENNNNRFHYIDKNQYKLKLNRIEEFDNDLLFECAYENQKQTSQSLIQLHIEKLDSPPILIYVPNNQTVPIGVDVRYPCQTKEKTNIQWFFNRGHKLIKIDNNKKYHIETNNDLIIRYVDKNDIGMYKCLVTNSNNDQTTWSGYLNVEDPRSNVVFKRVERKDLPAPPTQPIAIAINSNSIELAWNSLPSEDIQEYLIEYFNLNINNDENLEWKYFYSSSKNSRQLITDLKISSSYQFLIRARNSFGYGQPSLLSEIIQTRSEQQINNNNVIYLLNPLNVQQTSITIQWKFLQTNQLIEKYSISIINLKDSSERIETINNLTTYTLNNLRSNTDYSIQIKGFNSLTNGFDYLSNQISVKTLEGIPSSAPIDVQVELTSITSLSIRWNPPLESEQNGKILAYKVNCLGSNESTSIRLVNISSDAKGLHIKSLIESMQYCISVAARTQLGYGPYSQPICVTMNEEFLKLNRQLNSYNFKRRFREAITQPWFLPLIIISSILFTCAFLYAIWLCFHNFLHQHRHRMKFGSSNSSSSSNQFVEMPVQKTLSNGTRYDLIKDTPPSLPPSSSTALWTDTIGSGIRLQCCTTTTASASSQSEHDTHLMNIHKNPINTLLQQTKQQQQLNPYATTGIFHHNPSPQQTNSTILPTYSESIRSPPLANHHYPHQLIFDQQQSTVQYQPPWIDHPSSSFQYRSQQHTPYHHHCVHCTSQSHPHTPSSIRTTATATRHMHNLQQQQQPTNSPNMRINDVRWPMETTMNSPPLIKRQSQYAPPPLLPPPPQPSNAMMINSLGGETMTTSWASSTDVSNHESVSSSSSSSTDKNEQRQLNHEHSRSSSEGSLFSDFDNQQNQSNRTGFIDHERRPTFLMPTV